MLIARPLPLAGLARVVDHEAAAAARPCMARRGRSRRGSSAVLPGALTARADTGHRAGLGARCRGRSGRGPRRSAAGTRSRRRSRRRRTAWSRTPRRRRAAPGCWPCRAAAEEPAKQVAKTPAGPPPPKRSPRSKWAAAGPARRPSADAEPPEQRAGLVVLLAALLVGKHVVRLGDVLEPLLRRRRRPCSRPGWYLRASFAVGLLDLVVSRGLRNTEDLVVVLLQVVLRAHLWPRLSSFSPLRRGGLARPSRQASRLARCSPAPRPLPVPAAGSVRRPCSRAEGSAQVVLGHVRRVGVHQRLVDVRVERLAALSVADAARACRPPPEASRRPT